LGAVGNWNVPVGRFVAVDTELSATLHKMLLEQSWLVVYTVVEEVAPFTNPEMAVTE
jgi:hypothetical protein